jgi:hypothetical protein
MNLPIDPTDNDASPQDLIQNLPSKAARRRVLQASEISLDINDWSFAEALDELSQIELREAASQLRFAGARTIYYYRVDDLRQVSPEDAINQSGDDGSPGAYGSEIRETLRDHDRLYVVCNVPETGSQTQLTISEEHFEMTVATFKPRTQLLAIRAPDEGTADATVQTVVSHFGLDEASRISFLGNGLRGRFEADCIEGYSTLQLRHTTTSANTKEIEVRSKEAEDKEIIDVRTDAIVDDLLRRSDTELGAATGLVTVPTNVHSMEHDEPLHPRVTIGFPDGWVAFEQFVPEQILIEFDDLVRDSL